MPKKYEKVELEDAEVDASGAIGSEGELCRELGMIWSVAWPTAISTVLRAGTQQVTVMMVGHIGAAELGACALGTMWVNISGLSIVFGGMSALDTLCSQAFGAQNFKLVGLWAQRGILIILCLSLPISFLWFFGTLPLLSALGIPTSTAALSQEFTRVQTLWMLPVFFNRVIQTYWRSQRVVKPYKNATVAAFILHVPTCYFMTQEFGFSGAAWSLPINQWLLFCICMGLDRWKRISAKCWPRWSGAALRGWAPLLKMGGSGTLTTMGEWWSWEICAGMAGTLGEVPLGAHVIIQNFSFFYFPLPFSVSMGATIRVGNLLGAGDWKSAILVTKVTLAITNLIMMTCAVIVFITRHDFARIYTNDVRVREKVASVVDVYVFFVFLGGSTQCLRGVLAACGRQAVNARVSLVASYAVGLPISYALCFIFEVGLPGLWMGLVVSNVFRPAVLSWIVFRQDWAHMAKVAQAKAAEKASNEEERAPLAASREQDNSDEDAESD